MITSRKEYCRYVHADVAAYSLQRVNLYNWLRIDQLRFQLRLRRLEYLANCRRWRLLSRAVLEVMNHRLAVRLGVTVPKNVFGPGLCLVHRGTVVVSPLAKVGANCRIHPSTSIGDYHHPVTRFTASALQKVRTSANICARLVSSFINSIEMPLSVSFSVAST